MEIDSIERSDETGRKKMEDLNLTFKLRISSDSD